MKSKELIRQILELDPSGEVEVCVDNADILHIDRLPAYYDGRLQVLTRSEEGCVTKAAYVSKGDKIVISPRSITDIISDEEVEVDYSACSDPRGTRESHEKTRLLRKDISRSIEWDNFVRWALGKCQVLHPDATKEMVEHHSKWFRVNHVHPDNPLLDLPKRMSEGGYEFWPSYNDRRVAEWDATVSIEWSGLDFVFKKKETV